MTALILGGGITGLSAAWFLKKKNPSIQITLLEKSDRLGGWIRTSHEGGYLFEKGPRTFQLGRCPYLLELMRELNLPVLTAPLQNRYLWHKGKLRSVRSFFPLLLPYLPLQPFLAPAKENESIYEFACRRFNAKIAETLFDPITLGVYAGDIRKLSMRACFPHLNFMKSKGLFTLLGGMDTLIDALHKQINMDVIFRCEVESIRSNQVVAGGRVWRADQVISALPQNQFPRKSLWVVNLVYRAQSLTKKGFGYLIPSQENESVLGAIFDSSIFPQQSREGETRLTVMVRAEEANPDQAAWSAVKRHLGIQESPLFTSIFFANDAIPQFEVGCQNPHGISVEACVKRGLNLSQ